MTDNADSGHYHRSPAKKSKMFQPDPPIERQVQQIEQYFQDLIKCINDEIQTTRDYSYDADNSPRKSLKNRKKSSNSATIDAINYNLKEDIHKLFCDAWCFLRQGQKFDIGDQVQDMKSLFIQEFNDLKIYMQNLRNEQLNLLRDTVEIKGMKLKDSIIFNISNLMNDLIESLYADLLEIWLKSLDYNDHEFASSIFSSLLDNLADFSIGLNNFHFDIIRNVESLSRPIHETVNFMDTPDYIEATTQQLKDQKLCEFFEDYLNDTLVEFQEAANISHSMNQKITEFYNQMFEKLKVVDPTADQFDAELAFHSRVDNHSNICNIYSVLPTSVRNPPITEKFPIENPENDFDNSKNDSEENEDYDDDNNQEEGHNQSRNNKGANLENLWEKTRFQKYFEFVTSELYYTSNVLQEDLLSFWHDVHSSKLPYHSLAIGQMLYNVLDNRFTHFDKSLKPTEISEPFYLSVLYNDDDDLSYDYEELLESIVEQFSSELQGFRHHHIRFLSNPPSKVEKEINNFTQKASQLTNFIQTKALELNTALYQGREASFIISQRRENLIKSDFNKKSNNENESDSSSESSHKSEYSYSDSDDSDEDMFIDKFIIYDNEESDEIIKQLDKIAVLINNVFSNAKDKNASLLHGSLASSRNGSKSPSSSSKTTRITKSMKSSISSTMKKNILAQVNCIEDALSSTYLQLFASMKGTLVALIRSADYEQAGNVNREMRQRILEFVGHLNDVKKRASQNLDVKSVRAVDERINQLKSMESEDIEICILDSLRDVIDMTITNYDRNIKKINDEYHDYIQLLKSELGQNSQDVMEKDHIPALIKIEKEKMMALKREEKRSDPSFPEKRNAIRMLIENEQYDTADKETAQLEKLVIKTRKQRIEKVEQKYDLMKQQKIESQREELLMMEKRFSRKVQLAKENKKTAIESRFKILQSSIRSTSQRHLTFALKILTLDAKSKKELPKTLNSITNKVITERAKEMKELENLFTIEKKQVLNLNWMD